jgi:hypothetical protein
MGSFKEFLVVTVLRFQMWIDVNLFLLPMIERSFYDVGSRKN